MTDGPKPTPRYEAVLAGGSRLAREFGDQHVGVEHLFLAIIQDRDAIPTQVLAKIVELPEIEERLLGIMRSSSYSTESTMIWSPTEGTNEIES